MSAEFEQPGSTRARSGFTLMELTIAVAVFAVLLATSMKMITLISQQGRAIDERRAALETLQAVSEQVENIRWDNVSTVTADQLTLPKSAARLPDVALNLKVNEETDPTAKRVTIELTWKSRRGPAAPMRLTTWVFPDNATPPQ